jgi:hypothetical protein
MTMLTITIVTQAAPGATFSDRQERTLRLSEGENLRRSLFPEMVDHDEGYSGYPVF